MTDENINEPLNDTEAALILNSKLLKGLFVHLLDKRLLDEHEFKNLINEQSVSIQKQFGAFLDTSPDATDEDRDQARDFIGSLQSHLEKFAIGVLDGRR